MTSTGRAPYFVAIAPAFVRHPKLAELGGIRERWTWLELLCYCAEYGTGGRVPAGISSILPKVTGSFLERACTLGLVDLQNGSYRVHDWDEYNGTSRERLLARERKRRQRERQASEEEGGEEASDSVTMSRDTESDTVTESSRYAHARSTSNKPAKGGTASVVRSTSGARAAVMQAELSAAADLLEAAGIGGDDPRADMALELALRVPASLLADLEAGIPAHSLDPGGYVLSSLRAAVGST